MIFQFRKQYYFKVGLTFGNEWGGSGNHWGLLLFLGYCGFRIWFGKDPWKIEPSPLTLEELERADDD